MPDSTTSEAARHWTRIAFHNLKSVVAFLCGVAHFLTSTVKSSHKNICQLFTLPVWTVAHTKSRRPHTQTSYERQRGFDVITGAILSSIVDRILAAFFRAVDVGHVGDFKGNCQLGNILLQAKIFSTFTKNDLSRQDVAAACQQGYEAVMCTCVRSS